MAENMNAMALGPGLSTHPETQELIQRLASEIDMPIVIDADGLNALEGKTDILTMRREPTIVSPHPSEMARLAGLSTTEVEQKRKKIAAYCASIWRIEVILKGAPSVVATSDGELYINTTGNPGMATAGSGDVLTGILGALLCQGLKPDAAAVLGTYLHGLAGDRAAERFTRRGMIAGDIISCLPDAWRRLS
jgi:NAD(P)H-hydrate epimerase